MQPPRSIDILGCRVDDVTMDEAVAYCDALIRSGSPAHVVTPNAEIVMRAALAAAAPVHILLVAYGAPWQERWIARNAAALNVPLSMGIGGVFDFMAGRVRRAPPWLRRIGLDWLFRLAVQPWRWRRQL